MEEIIKFLEVIEAQNKEILEQNKEILELLQKKKQPSRETQLKPLEDRRKDFKMNCWNTFKDTISTQTIKEFFEYWSESNLDGKKMRFEKESVFDLSRRMNTWLRNNNKIYPSQSGANGLNVGN